MIKLENSQNISIKHSIFNENFMHDSIYIANFRHLHIYNISCLKNNVKGMRYFDGGGTCLVIIDVDSVFCHLLTIADSYNNYTTVGIKIIESKVNTFIFT